MKNLTEYFKSELKMDVHKTCGKFIIIDLHNYMYVYTSTKYIHTYIFTYILHTYIYTYKHNI